MKPRNTPSHKIMRVYDLPPVHVPVTSEKEIPLYIRDDIMLPGFIPSSEQDMPVYYTGDPPAPGTKVYRLAFLKNIDQTVTATSWYPDFTKASEEACVIISQLKRDSTSYDYIMTQTGVLVKIQYDVELYGARNAKCRLTENGIILSPMEHDDDTKILFHHTTQDTVKWELSFRAKLKYLYENLLPNEDISVKLHGMHRFCLAIGQTHTSAVIFECNDNLTYDIKVYNTRGLTAKSKT